MIKLVTLIIRLYYVLLIVGYLLQLITILTLITFPYIVHSIIAYITHHISTSPLLTYNVSLTDLVSCVDTVFSSSHCKTCSDYYLLLIIPFTVVGFILVLLLFLLNLTVTDGAVNGILSFMLTLLISILQYYFLM